MIKFGIVSLQELQNAGIENYNQFVRYSKSCGWDIHTHTDPYSSEQLREIFSDDGFEDELTDSEFLKLVSEYMQEYSCGYCRRFDETAPTRNWNDLKETDLEDIQFSHDPDCPLRLEIEKIME